MKKLILYIISIFLPWLGMILSDNPGGAAIALILQMTLIGWPFASHMALTSVREFYELDKKKKKKKTDESETEQAPDQESD